MAGSLGYQTAVDIANRALQHCRMARITSFTDSSLNAKETGFVYDKLREAELRSNIWRFAIKRAVLRGIDSTSLLWTPPSWAIGTTYAAGAVVTDANGEWWQSKTAANIANTPAAGAFWAHYTGPDYLQPYVASVSYFTGELVLASDGKVYLSLLSSNTGNDPTLSPTKWLLVNGTTVALSFLYPIGAGPVTDPSTRTVFRLPHGFLRRAPSNPRVTGNFYLGAPSGNEQEDWVFEDDYILSFSPGPLMLRYVQNMVDVPLMPAEFCEMLSARIAEECAPILAAAQILPAILRVVQGHYRRERIEAIRINGIEIGPKDFDLDDYIVCRL